MYTSDIQKYITKNSLLAILALIAFLLVIFLPSLTDKLYERTVSKVETVRISTSTPKSLAVESETPTHEASTTITKITPEVEPEVEPDVENTTPTPSPPPTSQPPPPKIPAPIPNPPKQTAAFDISTMLVQHNAARLNIGVAPLSWSTNLAKSAQNWADVLKSRGCGLQHDPNSPYGENIYWYWTTSASGSGLASSPANAVRWWIDEEQYYNYQKNSCKSGEQCGHYTQIVWEETKRVGCGVSSCFDGSKQTDVWVCRYDPPGNTVGQRPY